MQWKTRSHLRELTQHKHIFLPGLFNGMNYEFKYSKDLLDKKVVFTTDEVKALRTGVIFTWDSFKQFRHRSVFDDYPTRCLKSLNPKDSDICFHILSPSTSKYYVIFNFNELEEKKKGKIQTCAFWMTIYPQHSKMCNLSISNEVKMISWRNTSQICKNMNGFLPKFTFKKELDELIALLKLSHLIPPVHAMFIGLNLHRNQVNFCHILI